MATIKEDASHAGVATATESRVLSNPAAVEARTRKSALVSVLSLGYAPNFPPKSLRSKCIGKIAVSVPDISNPFFSEVIQGAEEVAQAAG
ncbi:MAG: LacI family DNA-binding transcriptional regulator [Alphaproteobacteria bacterium]